MQSWAGCVTRPGNVGAQNNVVVGDPGSGKSTALKGRIEQLISNGCKISSQLVMTLYLTGGRQRGDVGRGVVCGGGAVRGGSGGPCLLARVEVRSGANSPGPTSAVVAKCCTGFAQPQHTLSPPTHSQRPTSPLPNLTMRKARQVASASTLGLATGSLSQPWVRDLISLRR